MDGKYYSNERSIQILISLLKQHGIKKCVLSPGVNVSKLWHNLFYAQSPDFRKPGLCYSPKFLYL